MRGKKRSLIAQLIDGNIVLVDEIFDGDAHALGAQRVSFSFALFDLSREEDLLTIAEG